MLWPVVFAYALIHPFDESHQSDGVLAHMAEKLRNFCMFILKLDIGVIDGLVGEVSCNIAFVALIALVALCPWVTEMTVDMMFAGTLEVVAREHLSIDQL